ncbi:right-handed parallel beta-helix repeat-containing protein [Actinosynnema sp. NPDC047251]|uniref:Plastocyanin n=1 Tax=Saccharothrix espanaensis (strain ATCC 51144 / DSM 44229 / JCM 9112 / NBRC 15066 / NRRL 15764) TaxID=1179773 RepID=K0K4P4_SACES|nr:right-handed parallel beta-helix repeat-containing protein [Saccharothrix espanaensis]CCH31844.1 Plastocyanin [Saccharothrix espanaensis DSM 44229]
MTRLRDFVLPLLVVLTAATACTTGTAESGTAPGTIRVPQDEATIGSAVDRARPGDVVLVSPGVYRESVRIRTDHVTLRGTDRNGVVIDGEGRRRHGVVVTAPAVAVENLTVRDHLLNGVLFTGATRDGSEPDVRGNDGYQRLDPEKSPPLQGFRVRYVTAANNGLYGIYAFNARQGTIEHNYASGSSDSGIYVGQCKPCHILVADNVAEYNAVGYEGTNAGTGLWVLRNRFTHNRVGLTVNSDYLEAFRPQENSVIAGNLVADNAEAQTPHQADGGFGIGIGIGGGQRNTVVRNLVRGHPRAGLMLAATEDIPAAGNTIEANVFTGNAADLANVATARAPSRDNCLRHNTFTTTYPPDLPVDRCLREGAELPAAPAPRTPEAPAGIPFRDVPLPPPQPQLPDTAPTPVEGPSAVPPLDRVGLPDPTLLAENSRSRP